MSDPTSQPQDAEHCEDEAAEAEERRLDQETPDALNTLSETAQRFLRDPEIDAATGADLPDDATGDQPPQDGDPGH